MGKRGRTLGAPECTSHTLRVRRTQTHADHSLPTRALTNYEVNSAVNHFIME